MFCTEIAKAGYSQPNLMGLLACQTAYEQGAQWLDDLNQYLEDNLDLIRNFCRKDLKGIRLVEPEVCSEKEAKASSVLTSLAPKLFCSKLYTD